MLIWRSSCWFLRENFLVIISCNKKKLNIGKSKVNDTTNICKLFCSIMTKLLSGINPPEDIVVKARWKESRSLKSTNEYKKITKTVDEK